MNRILKVEGEEYKYTINNDNFHLINKQKINYDFFFKDIKYIRIYNLNKFELIGLSIALFFSVFMNLMMTGILLSYLLFRYWMSLKLMLITEYDDKSIGNITFSFYSQFDKKEFIKLVGLKEPRLNSGLFKVRNKKKK